MSDDTNRREVLKNIATGGAIAVSPAAAAGKKKENKDVLSSDVLRDVLKSSGNPKIKEINQIGVKKLEDPKQRIQQRVKITKGITSNGKFKYVEAIGDGEVFDIKHGDIGVSYEFDHDIWDYNGYGKNKTNRKRAKRQNNHGRKKKKNKLPKKLKRSPSRIFIHAEKSDEKIKKKIIREATDDEKEAAVRELPSFEASIMQESGGKVLKTSGSDQYNELRLTDLPIFISITDNELMLGRKNVVLDNETNPLDNTVETKLSQGVSGSNYTTQDIGGCGCTKVGIWDSGPCPKCAATQPGCVSAISSCVASLGLLCITTLSCVVSGSVCACCVVCLDNCTCGT